ncbi:MAG: 50S ribosomal protein L4 [Verrucomicrobia bacterium SCN 57-15]|nr:MAG: 50S ribosomal protein L4 [Verrucomicrobia bacterium SCN 57-15]
MKVAIKNINGKEAGELNLSFEPVEASKGTQAVHDVVVAYMAAQRSGTACTKTMGEVAGSGKKPWRQKGTGRARAGSFASPLWRGGGVVFGPKPRDFSKKVTKKTRQLALRKAFTERVNAGDVVVIDEIKLDTPKTKTFVNLLRGLEADKGALIVADSGNDNLTRASRNVESVELTSSSNLNTYQLLRYNKVLITRSAMEALDQRLKQD